MLPDRRPWQTVLTSLVMIVWMQKKQLRRDCIRTFPVLGAGGARANFTSAYVVDSTFVNGH